MRIKRLLAFALALIMMLSATSVFAATGDLVDKDGKVLNAGSWMFSGYVVSDLGENPQNYQVEVGGKNYAAKDVIAESEKTGNEDKSLSELVVPLTPVTPPTPPTPVEELKVEGITLNDAKTVFTVNFNRAVVAKDEETLKIEVLQDGNPLLGGPGYKLADDKKSATITFTKELSVGKYTIKVTNPNFTSEVFEVKAPEVVQAIAKMEATDTKTIAVTFVKAVETTEQPKAVFAFDRDGVVVTPPEPVWSADKMKATFAFTTDLFKGQYGVSVTGLTTDAITAKCTVAAKEIKRIEILNKSLKHNDSNEIKIEVYNQYNQKEAAILTQYTFFARNITKAKSYTVTKNTFTTGANDNGDEVKVKVIHDATNTEKEVTLKIVNVAPYNVSFGEIAPPAGQARVYKNDKEITLPINVTNETMAAYNFNDKELSKMVGYPKVTYDGVEWEFSNNILKAEIKDNNLKFNVSGDIGEATIKAVVLASSTVATKKFTINETPIIAKVEFAEIADLVQGQDYEVKAALTDQYGDPVSVKKGYDFTKDFTIADPATNDLTFGKFIDGEKFKLSVKTGPTDATLGDHTITFTCTAKNEFKTELKVSVVARQELGGIKLASEDDKTVRIHEGSKKTVKFVIYDKNEEEIKGDALDAYAGYKIFVDVATTTLATDLGGAYAKAITAGTGMSVGIEDVATLESIIGGTTAMASNKFTFQIQDASNTNQGDSCNVTITNVAASATGSLLTFNVKNDLPIKYNDELKLELKLMQDASNVETGFNGDYAIEIADAAPTKVSRVATFVNGVMTKLDKPVKMVWSGNVTLKATVTTKTGVTQSKAATAIAVEGTPEIKGFSFIISDQSTAAGKMTIVVVDENGNKIASLSDTIVVSKFTINDKVVKPAQADGQVALTIASGIIAEADYKTAADGTTAAKIAKGDVIKIEYGTVVVVFEVKD